MWSSLQKAARSPLVKGVILLLFCVGVIGWFGGLKWQHAARTAMENREASLAGAQTTREQILAANKRLQDTAPSAASHLTLAYPQVMASLKAGAQEDAVKLGEPKVKNAKAGAMLEIEKVSKPSEAPGLRRISLKLTGKYETYPGLLKFMERLRALPVAVTAFDIEADQIQLELEVYGR